MRLIDADALIDDCKKYLNKLNPSRDGKECTRIHWLIGILSAAPTIEPEQRWIPCSERLPEDEYVLISKKPTMLSGSKWCVTIAIRMADPRSGKIQWRDIGFDIIQDDKVLAWMPLPKAYQEVK